MASKSAGPQAATTNPPSAARALPGLDGPLPRIVCRAMIRALVHNLPDPIEDTLDNRTERDHAAITEIALLAPADAGELRVAIRCVAADARANAYQQLMNEYSNDMPTLLRLGSPAATWGRLASANHAELERTQAGRRRRGKGNTAEAEQEAERRAYDGLMQAWQELAEELGKPLPKAPAVAAFAGARPAALHGPKRFEQAVAERREEAVAAAAAGAPEPDWVTPAWRQTLDMPEPPPPTEDDQQRLRLLGQADEYAVLHPMRARLIRRLGGLPPDCGVEPPPPDLLDAIRTGEGSNLLWADRLTPARARQNAGRDRDLLCRYEADLAEAAVPG